jgi:uncharacterized membrane protein (DUF4010 family)
MTDTLPPLLLQFTATVVLCFVLGLELHSYRRSQAEGIGFGTTRTLTLIGAVGFVLWQLDGARPEGLYFAGLAALALWLGVDLWRRAVLGKTPGEVQDEVQDDSPGDSGGALLPSVIALLAYALGPLVLTQPDWFVAAVMVVGILMLGEKPLIRRLSDAFPSAEGVTLAKFLIIAGLVLPLTPVAALPGLPTLTYQKVWLAVVAISGLSYVGYVAHRYLWPRAGVLVTGLIGGLYSSTAVTIVLGRESRKDAAIAAQAPAAIVLAIMVMYLRLLALIALLGHVNAARALLLPYGAVILGSAVVAFVLWRFGNRAIASAAAPTATPVQLGPHNPLDLPIALLFGALFIAFAAITQFITTHYGAGALKLLSLLVGFTDINPFILSLVATHGVIQPTLMVDAILIASVTNNLVNACYALILARQRLMAPVAAWFALCLAAALFWTGWL